MAAKDGKVRTNAQFLAEMEAAFAIAETESDFGKIVDAAMAEVAERGLHLQANYVFRQYRERLVEKPARPELGPGWMGGHVLKRGVHIVAPPNMPCAEIAAILREIAASLDEEKSPATAPSANP